MGKRFTDTDIWTKTWFRKLSTAEKTAFSFIKDNCDNVGVWDPDKELAEFCIGASVNWDELLEKCNGNIEVLSNGKWWVVDFVRFQHSDMFAGSLSNACKSYIALLKKHGLYEAFPELFQAFGKPDSSLAQGLAKPRARQRLAPKEREKEKERVKAREKERAREEAVEVIHNEDRSVYHLIETAFLSKNKDFNYGREGRHLVELEKKALAREDPVTFIKKVIVVFWELTHSNDKLFKDQPFLPSILNSGGLWPRVLKRIEQMKEQGAELDPELEQVLDTLFLEKAR